MQDRFKFRAHVKDKKKWCLDFSNQEVFEVLEVGFGGNGIETVTVYAFYDNDDYAVREIDFVDVELIQSTGLKDKNGKLIYEGDILKDANNTISYVVYFAPSFWVESPGSHAGSLELNNFYNRSEIIGNIYENPELLKETRENKKC